MTQITSYDWGLEGPFEPPAKPQGDVSPTLQVFITRYRRAAEGELVARDELRSFLGTLNRGQRPKPGDWVVPWALLHETTPPRYQIIGLDAPESDDPIFVVRAAAKGSKAQFVCYGISDFLVLDAL